MRKLWIAVIGLPVLLLAGLAIVIFSGNQQLGCSKIKDAEGVGDCYVDHLNIPFEEEQSGAIDVVMSVGDRPQEIATLDTGAFAVRIDDRPTKTELDGSKQINVIEANGTSEKEIINEAAVCIVVTTRVNLCQGAATVFGGEHSAVLVGQSFLKEFTNIEIDRLHHKIRLSGHTSDKPIVLTIDDDLYRLHFN